VIHESPSEERPRTALLFILMTQHRAADVIQLIGCCCPCCSPWGSTTCEAAPTVTLWQSETSSILNSQGTTPSFSLPSHRATTGQNTTFMGPTPVSAQPQEGHALNSIQFVESEITNSKLPSEGFTVCTHATPLTFDLTSDQETAPRGCSSCSAVWRLAWAELQNVAASALLQCATGVRRVGMGIVWVFYDTGANPVLLK